MSAWDWCRECKTMHEVGVHLPLWRVCNVDDLDDEVDNFVRVRAAYAEQAAERWAEQDDAGGDYNIVGRNYQPTVVVQDSAGTEVGRFVVTGESVPQYRARKAP